MVLVHYDYPTIKFYFTTTGSCTILDKFTRSSVFLLRSDWDRLVLSSIETVYIILSIGSLVSLTAVVGSGEDGGVMRGAGSGLDYPDVILLLTFPWLVCVSSLS